MKKKNIWIMNHYATNQFFNEGGRHFWFAKNLKKRGYLPTVFCSNKRHNSDDNIEIEKGKYKIKQSSSLPYIFVKTSSYKENGIHRIFNMISFFRNLFPVAKDFAKKHGKPDIILASSVHPLTLLAGIKIAKKYNVPCICEIRDLWPESIIAYGALKRNGIIAKVLFQGEKWIYKRADSIIMSWEGGKQYIINQGWEKQINLKKVKHISNGVVIDSFDKNSKDYVLNDPNLDDAEYKNIVYAGSIRKVNNLGMLLDAAKIIKGLGRTDIRFLIFGSGDEKISLEKRCEKENIDNVIFKGQVEKKFVPSILKKSYINILHNSSTSLDKYGQSQNKLFEYLAAGKCIVQTYTTGYSICDKFNCGITAPIQNAEEIANTIILACDDRKNNFMGKNARQAAYNYDFTSLTDNLIKVIESIDKSGKESDEFV